MATSWSEIITDYAMTEIDDIRLAEELLENPALFFRRMSLYLKNGAAYFDNPPEVQSWLKFTEPQFADYEWTAETSADETEVDTQLTGYDIMSAVILTTDAVGTPVSIPYHEAVYDSETGIVTFPAGLEDGTVFSLDFYTDGQFENTLTLVEKRILGKCAALVWNERFDGNWLNMQPKIHDKSFTVGSESNHIRAVSEKMRRLRAELNDELRRYEQNIAYRDTAKRGYLNKFTR